MEGLVGPLCCTDDQRRFLQRTETVLRIGKRAENEDHIVRLNPYTISGHFARHERMEEMANDLRDFFNNYAKKKLQVSDGQWLHDKLHSALGYCGSA